MKRTIIPLDVFGITFHVYLGGEYSDFLDAINELEWLSIDISDAEGICSSVYGNIVIWAKDDSVLIHEMSHACTSVVDYIEGEQGDATANEVRAYVNEWLWKEIDNGKFDTWDSGQRVWRDEKLD